jgi:hypothetical protein
MNRLFSTLSEKDRRHYPAIEVAKLGSSGISTISGLFDLDTKTVLKVLTGVGTRKRSRAQPGSKKGGGHR